ncbi:MAG: hypothetical protein QXU71_01505 [Candidatus Aenigmatarchaeota archaeon]
MAEIQNGREVYIDIASEINRRVRVLETKFEQLIEKINLLEKSILEVKNDLKIYINFNNSRFQENNSKIEVLEKEIENIKSYIQELVSKSEIEKLKTIIDLFNPLKSNFVTREELEEILNEFKTKRE